MTEQIQPEVIDVAEQENLVLADNDAADLQEEAYNEGNDESVASYEQEDSGDDVEFPKKAVNALNRKTKQINKLRAQKLELEAKLQEIQSKFAPQEINPDDFETYGDFLEAKLNHRDQQSKNDMQTTQLTQQKEQVKAQQNQYIVDQAYEVAKTFTDLPIVWNKNAQLLDALPEEITDIFYSVENAPAAVYMLAKEGKLEGLLYANPAVAAYEIINAQNKGMELLSKPKIRSSQAPQPISKAKGTGSIQKQLSPSDDVLKSLGLKK